MTVHRVVAVARVEVLVDGAAGDGVRAIIRDKERTIEKRTDDDAQCALDLKHLSWLLYYIAGNWTLGLGTDGPAFADPRELKSAGSPKSKREPNGGADQEAKRSMTGWHADDTADSYPWSGADVQQRLSDLSWAPWRAGRGYDACSRMYQLVCEKLGGVAWAGAALASERAQLLALGYAANYADFVLTPWPAGPRCVAQANSVFNELSVRYQFAEIDFGALTFKSKLGSGGFGLVYLALWHEQQVAVKMIRGLNIGISAGGTFTLTAKDDSMQRQTSADSSTMQRQTSADSMQRQTSATRSENSEAVAQGWREFVREMQLAKQLGHPNIITTFGTTFGTAPRQSVATAMIVMEYLPNGSLFSLLEKERDKLAATTATPVVTAVARATTTTSASDDHAATPPVVVARLHADPTTAAGAAAPVGRQPRAARAGAGLRSFKVRRRMALEIASGMQFLHERRLAHRDLKSLNVLVTKNLECKVSDFGQAKSFSALGRKKLQKGHALGRGGTMTTSGQQGTVWWTAPECGDDRWTQPQFADFMRADVWSFGVICWELLTLRHPKEEYHPGDIGKAAEILS